MEDGRFAVQPDEDARPPLRSHHSSSLKCYPSALTSMPSRTRIQPLHIAIDTGGTFTDCVWVEDGQVRMLKVFSTPDDPSRAIVEALGKIGQR